ncbi:MAG: hypothetical protein KDA71_12795, partial [Planctomycetales bacterium]|nr:hypothetical protein [Planctomycetales bacterium]
MIYRPLASFVVLSLVAGSAAAQPPAVVPLAPAGKYQVVPYSHNSAILLETATGKCWKLQKDQDTASGFVWIPIRQLNTNMEVDQF